MVCDNQQIVLKDREDNRPSMFTVRDAENAMMTFTIFAIAVIVGIFLYEIVLKRNSIVSALYAVVVNVSKRPICRNTANHFLKKGFDLMFLRRTREELCKT